MAGKNISFYIRKHPEKSLFIYLLFLGLILTALHQPYPWVNDETTYVLMTDTLQKTGDLHLDNGVEKNPVKVLELHAAKIRGDKLNPLPPPLYAHLTLIQYSIFGISGLNFTNILAHLLTTALVYFAAKKLYNPATGLLSAIIYSIFTYSLIYSFEVWPHSLSILLSFAPAVLALYSRRWDLMFFAGLISGLSFGVRYTNLILTGLIFLYLVSQKKWLPTISFCVGAAIPILWVFSINIQLWGGPMMTGYGDAVTLGTNSYRLSNMIFAAAVTSFFVFIWNKLSKASKKNASIAGVFIAAVTLPYWIEPAKLVFSQVFDFSFSPRHWFVPKKRALIQASPILGLAVWGLVKDGRNRLILMIPPLMLIMYFSGLAEGDGSLRLMRYLLESMPYLAIAACIPLVDYLKEKIDVNKVYYIFSLLLVLAAVDFSAPDEVNLITYKIPLFLGLILMAQPFLNNKKSTVTYIILAAAIYSLLVNAVYMYESVENRKHHMDSSNVFMDNVKSNSLIAYCGYLDQIPTAYLKTQKRVHIAYLQRGSPDENINLINGYLQRGWSVYFLQAPFECKHLDLIKPEFKTNSVANYGLDYDIEGVVH